MTLEPEPALPLEADQRQFYRECVAAQFNRVLARQRELARGDEAEARVLEEMEAVRASIEVHVAICVASDVMDRIRLHASRLSSMPVSERSSSRTRMPT